MSCRRCRPRHSVVEPGSPSPLRPRKPPSSAVKRVDLAVFDNIAAAVKGSFKGGFFSLTAANAGITYAPPHDAKLPSGVADKLEVVRKGLAAGTTNTGVDPVTGLPK